MVEEHDISRTLHCPNQAKIWSPRRFCAHVICENEWIHLLVMRGESRNGPLS